MNLSHDQIADLVYGIRFSHRYTGAGKSKRGCSCGWKAVPMKDYPGRIKLTSGLQHERHLADVVATELLDLAGRTP